MRWTGFVSRLKQIPFFKDFANRDLSRLSFYLQEKRLAAHKIILQEESRGQEFYWIEKGKVAIYKEIEKLGPQSLALLSDGDFFGEMNLLIAPTRFASAKTLEDTLLVVFKDSHFKRLLKQDKALALRLLKQLFIGCAGQLKTTTENLCGLTAFVHHASVAQTTLELKDIFVETLKKILLPASCKGGILFDFNRALGEYTPQAHWGEVAADLLVAKNELTFPTLRASLLKFGSDGKHSSLLIVEPKEHLLNKKIPLLEILGNLFERIRLRLESTAS